ncbi:MAG: tetratricopeptide repeat protein [Syntrophobacteraceae bacterium]
MMTPRIMKYNPAFLTSDELIASFVVRHADLELTLETIRHNTGDSTQHILIIGPRGVGKTTLVLRAVAEVRRDVKLKGRWFPIVFGEDSYEVCSPGEFWLEALFHLGEQTQSEKWRRVYRELKLEQDEIRLRERALAQLMDFADEQNKRILLVVENLNIILGEQIDGNDAWVLRHTLQNEPRLMLLGTATSRFKEIHNYGKAMYELLKIHDLEPLNTDDCRAMWRAITGEELSEARVRPIKILTGGNPRLLSIIANFAARISLRELMLDLTQLVDEHTEYFKSHLEGLPSLERKVFVALVDMWDPLTAREVARAARVSVNKTSSLLNRLTSRGAVVVFETQGRKKLYQVAERMYNIYHLMRRRGGPSSRIGAVVNFMIHFYESDLLVHAVTSVANEACKLDSDQRQDHYQFYETILQKSPSTELQETILRATPEQFFENPDVPSTIKESLNRVRLAPAKSASLEKDVEVIAPTKPLDAASWIARRDQLRGSAVQLQEAEAAYRKAIELDPNYTWAWVQLGGLMQNLGRFQEAEAAYRKAIELDPSYTWAWVQLGGLTEKLERFQEAEDAYRKAIELDPNDNWAWVQLGGLLHERLERFEEAEAAYRKALELKPHNAWAWSQLGQLLHEKLERFEEAEDAYRKAVELDPGHDWMWAQLGRLLHEKLERFQEAEAAYRKAVELDPGYVWVWALLGLLLHEKLERFEEAEVAYRKAIESDPNYYWAWGKLGHLLHEKFERFEEAEAAYRKAIELKPDYIWAWAQLGRLLHEKLERYPEAEAAYRKAIELNPNYNWAWVQLGELMGRLEHFEEAEAAYREAIELDPNYNWVWVQLGELLHEKLERFQEAEVAYRKAVELSPGFLWAWAKLGKLLHEKLEHFEEAEAAYRKAIELYPDYTWAWAQLGQLLHEKLERFQEAEAAYRKAIKLDPNYNWARVQLGDLLEKLEHFDEAEAAYRKAIELDPNYNWAWVQLGGLMEKLEHFDEAEAAYRKATELDPNYHWAWIQLGDLMEKLEHFEEAEAAYHKAIELDPGDAWTWVQLGQFLQEVERFEEAEAAYRKAVELDPGDTWARVNLGRLLHEKLERFVEAEAAYRQAIELDPGYNWARVNLGQLLHEKLERFDEAEAAYRKAIELDPSYNWAWAQLGRLMHDLGSIGQWQQAIEIASWSLAHKARPHSYVGQLTDFFIGAAASGYAKDILTLLENDPSPSILEPLVAGLQIFLGEEPVIAQEILEVGRDVAKRIEVRKQQTPPASAEAEG